MASIPNNSCNTCGKPATLQCSRCAEGVQYDGSLSPLVYYCSGVCQKADFATHKSGCKQSQSRKILYRAAEQLQACFYVVQRAAFTVNIAKVSVNAGSGQLRVVEDPQVKPPSGFPDHMFSSHDEQAKHSVLAIISSGTDHMEANMTALGYMQRDPALKDIAESSNAIEFVPPPHARKVDFVRAARSRVPDLTPKIQHIVLRLQLGKESYAFDVASAEIGFTKPLLPWKDYDERVLSNVLTTMQSSLLMRAWTSEAEKRAVARVFRFRAEYVPGEIKDIGMSYARMTQSETFEEVQDELVPKYASCLRDILGGKRELFDRFLADMLRAFAAKLAEVEASPRGQGFRGVLMPRDKIREELNALPPGQRKKLEAARAAMFPGMEDHYLR